MPTDVHPDRSGFLCEPHEDVPALPGHALTPVVTFYDNDDSAGYASCSCGWRSRSVKTCWIDKQFGDHLDSVVSDEERG